jgi:hypothetical protein
MQELDYSGVQGNPLPFGRVPRSYENTVLNLMDRIERLEKTEKEPGSGDSSLRSKGKPMQNISFEELVQALNHARIWMRHEPADTTAFLMHVLHPEDAARDIFFKAMTVKDD